MKKSKLIVLIVLVSLFLCSCRHYGDYNMQPEDDLSRAMHDAVGEDFYYFGKEESESGEVWYRYAIQKTESNAIEEFGNAAESRGRGYRLVCMLA